MGEERRRGGCVLGNEDGEMVLGSLEIGYGEERERGMSDFL